MDNADQKIKIAPSILSADFTRLGEQVREADASGAAMIHIDVMDGRFVPNISMGPLVVGAVRRVTGLPLDVHLMIVEPERHIEAFAKAGADRITIHYEATPNVHSVLTQICALGCKPGIALNPHTPAHLLIDLMHTVDVINVMTVNPGSGGQTLLAETLPKVKRLRAMIRDEGREVDLEVDGGINTETALTAVQAGANVLVVGSYVFSGQHRIEDRMRSLFEVWEQKA